MNTIKTRITNETWKVESIASGNPDDLFEAIITAEDGTKLIAQVCKLETALEIEYLQCSFERIFTELTNYRRAYDTLCIFYKKAVEANERLGNQIEALGLPKPAPVLIRCTCGSTNGSHTNDCQLFTSEQ